MTNIVGIGILIIVTNWSMPIIPKSEWKMIHEFKGVPATRGRVGVVVERKVVKFDWDGHTNQVVIAQRNVRHIQQIGKVRSEKIVWTQGAPLILKGDVKKPVKVKPLKKRKWYRLWQ